MKVGVEAVFSRIIVVGRRLTCPVRVSHPAQPLEAGERSEQSSAEVCALPTSILWQFTPRHVRSLVMLTQPLPRAQLWLQAGPIPD